MRSPRPAAAGVHGVVQAQEAAFQAPEAIAATALSYLREQLSALPGQPSISIDPPRNERLTPCDAMSRFAVRHEAALPDDRGHPLHRAQSLDRLCPGQRQRAGPILRRLAHHRGRPGIDPGRPGAARDLVALPRARSPTGHGGRHDGGLSDHRRPADQGAALRNAQSVRGSNVRINAVGKGFMVSSEGQALDNAAPGATVQVRMPSGQVVSGVVRNAGLVEMHL